MSEPFLEVQGLHKEFGGFVAVYDFDLSLPEGGSIGIVGESGSGKTTVARMLVGLETPDSGTVTFRGRERTRPATSTRERRRRGGEIQIVFQDPYGSLDPRQSYDQSLDDVLRINSGLGRAERRRRAAELADLVGLDRRQRQALPRHLSGGQHQRIAVAKALAAEPEILILDEAVAALDVSIQAQILNLFADVRKATGVAIIFISHDLAVIRQTTERIVVMQSGKIVEAGPTEQVLDHPNTPYTALLRASVPHRGWMPSIRARAGAPTGNGAAS